VPTSTPSQSVGVLQGYALSLQQGGTPCR